MVLFGQKKWTYKIVLVIWSLDLLVNVGKRLTVRSPKCAEDPEELINLAISREERVLSELKNC